jgi:hypothetical protein
VLLAVGFFGEGCGGVKEVEAGCGDLNPAQGVGLLLKRLWEEVAGGGGGLDGGGVEAGWVGQGEEVAGDADGLVELFLVFGGFAADELEGLLAVDEVVAVGAAQVYTAALEGGADEVGGEKAVVGGEVVRLDVVGAQAQVEFEVEGGDGLLV